MRNEAYTESWKSYMHCLNIQTGGSGKGRVKHEGGKTLARIYNNAVNAMNAAISETSHIAAAEIFKAIPRFQGADLLDEQCLDKAEDCRKDSVYMYAKAKMDGNVIADYEETINSFRTEVS